VPASLNAGNWSISSGSANANDGPVTLRPLSFGSAFDSASAFWTGYTIRADSAGPYQVSVTYVGDQPCELRVGVDGSPLGTVNIQSTNGAEQTSSPLSTTLAPGLHSIRVQSLRGPVNVRSIRVDLAAQPTPTPTRTSTPAPTVTPTPTPVLSVDEPPPAPDAENADSATPAPGIP